MLTFKRGTFRYTVKWPTRAIRPQYVKPTRPGVSRDPAPHGRRGPARPERSRGPFSASTTQPATLARRVQEGASARHPAITMPGATSRRLSWRRRARRVAFDEQSDIDELVKVKRKDSKLLRKNVPQAARESGDDAPPTRQPGQRGARACRAAEPLWHGPRQDRICEGPLVPPCAPDHGHRSHARYLSLETHESRGAHPVELRMNWRTQAARSRRQFQRVERVKPKQHCPRRTSRFLFCTLRRPSAGGGAFPPFAGYQGV